MARISKDPVTEVTGRGDPGVLAILPAPTFGHCAQSLALQETEAEAGNGILFLLVSVTFVITVPEGYFKNKRKSKMCIAFLSEQVGDITPT